LNKKPTSLGVRFSSGEATLIIDGNFAAFVADEEKNYGRCRAAGTALYLRMPESGSPAGSSGAPFNKRVPSGVSALPTISDNGASSIAR
jgi:hypothetical protein